MKRTLITLGAVLLLAAGTVQAQTTTNALITTGVLVQTPPPVAVQSTNPPVADAIVVLNAQGAAAALIHYLCPNISYGTAAFGIYFILTHIRARWAKGNTGLSRVIGELVADPPPPAAQPTTVA